jgi:hypothetical protein
VITLLVVIGALAVIAAGIVGIVQGERHIEHHEEEPAGATEGETEGALATTPPPLVITIPGLPDAA